MIRGTTGGGDERFTPPAVVGKVKAAGVVMVVGGDGIEPPASCVRSSCRS
jgi:hypothetical protein